MVGLAWLVAPESDAGLWRLWRCGVVRAESDERIWLWVAGVLASLHHHHVNCQSERTLGSIMRSTI